MASPKSDPKDEHRQDADDVVDHPAWAAAADAGHTVERRIDSYATLAKPVKRPDGTLLMHGTLAKPGIMQYADASGTYRRELVTAETLRDKDWLRSVARAPVTLEHPVRDGQLVDVTPDNFQVFGVGDTDGEVEVDEDDFVRIKLAARRGDAIAEIKTGKSVELSPGYDCVYDPTPGKHPVYGDYDGQQLARRCNHIAITEAARGGHDIGLRADSGVMVMARRDSTRSGGSDTMNKKLRDALLKLGVPKAEAEKAARADSLDDFVTDLTEATRGDAGTVREMYDELNDDFRKANSARDKLQGLCDAQSKEIEAFKEKFAKAKKGDSDTERLAWFGERQKLMALATEHKVDSAETMDNLSLLRAVVKADNKDMPDDASEDRLRGYLDAVDSRTDAKSKGNPWESLSAPRGDNADPPPRRGETRRDADPFSVQMHNIDKSAGRAR